ncbi:MAG: transposase [Bacteroidota bacterium]|nr:transposase [Bacteroidota bacterium]
MPIKLPDWDEALNMIVIKGFGSKPMMLLTTLPIQPVEKDLWFIIQAYMKRWSIEETIRFIKQTYDLENIRLLKYKRLQNMMALLLAVFYFIAVIIDQSQKLTIMAGYILKVLKGYLVSLILSFMHSETVYVIFFHAIRVN